MNLITRLLRYFNIPKPFINFVLFQISKTKSFLNNLILVVFSIIFNEILRIKIVELED